MRVLPLRLAPGTDLRLGLEQVLQGQKEQAGWVLSGIGSLSVAPLRLAGQEELTTLKGNLEILMQAGSLSPDGAICGGRWRHGDNQSGLNLFSPSCQSQRVINPDAYMMVDLDSGQIVLQTNT